MAESLYGNGDYGVGLYSDSIYKDISASVAMVMGSSASIQRVAALVAPVAVAVTASATAQRVAELESVVASSFGVSALLQRVSGITSQVTAYFGTSAVLSTGTFWSDETVTLGVWVDTPSPEDIWTPKGAENWNG